MAETLFTDIIDNLGKTVKKIKGDKPGKFFIDPVFNPDGSRKIVGGYGSEDRAAFIEKDKSGIKGTIQYGNDDTNKKFRLTSDGKNTQGEIVFKFADGGSTNGSAEKAFSAKVNELMDDGYDFGEAVKEAMRQGYNKGGQVVMEAMIQKLYTDFGQALVDSESLKKHGKSIRDITSDQRGNLKRRLEKFKSFIKENNRMPSEDEARKLGRKDKAITDAVGKDGKGITEDKIRKNMIKKGETVKMIQGKVVFADLAKQKQFVEDLTKRYELGKRSTKAVAAGVLRNEDIYNKYFKGIYSPSSVRTVIDRFKKAMDLEYYKLSPQERDINKLNRIADELITQGGKRLSGTKTSPVHHLFPLGDEYVKARGKDFAILDDKTNAAMQSYNKSLKNLVKERQQIIKDKISNKITVEEFNTKNNSLNEKATKIITRYNTNNPGNEGLLNWRKLSMTENNKVLVDKPIGGDYKKHSVDPENRILIEKLGKQDLRKYRELLKKKSTVNDLKKIEGVTTADKIEQPEKSKIRGMFDNFNEKFRSSKPVIQKFSSKIPGSALALAPTEFALSLAAGVPLYDAAASAGSYLLKDPAIGKAVNVPLALRAMTDYEDADEMIKRANKRRLGIETFLEEVPSKAKQFLTQGERATYQNIEDYLPDEDLSGILSVKGVQ